MDETRERLVRARAYEIWEAQGRPEGRALEHWLEAERESLSLSVAGEEDPLAGVDEGPPGAFKPEPGGG